MSIDSHYNETKWVNQHGSIAVFYFDPNNTSDFVPGYYVNKAKQFIQSTSEAFPLIGWINSGKVITWTVNWMDSSFNGIIGVTAWTGVFDVSNRTIYTNWLFTTSKDFWKSTLIGSDTFHRVD